MRNLILIATLFLFVINAFSQEENADSKDDILRNKNGAAILPQKGDIAIGIDLAPFFTYAGNMFNDNTNNLAPSITFMNSTYNDVALGNVNAPTTSRVYGKYFLTDNSALRVSVEYTGVNDVDKIYVRDDAAFSQNPLSNNKVVDQRQVKGSTVIIGLGFEKRRGYRRLQGFYGAGVYYIHQTYSANYQYSNPYAELNTNPTSHDFDGNVLVNGDRVTERNYGNSLGLGLNGFIGVEYFILPKMSIGAELAWGMMYSSTNQSSETYETMEGSTGVVKDDITSPGSSFFGKGTMNPSNASASMFLSFYF